MRHLALIFTCLFILILPALAADWSPRAPEKPVTNVVPPPADPEVLRQGGDTIADAVAVPIPYSGSGTTTGYYDDYNEDCPFYSTSPDVVYLFVPDTDTIIDIDMFGSTYDTKIYVYDADLALVACNDDFYPDYVSKLENLAVTGGATYYLVIDGYGGDAGDYVLEISEFVPCVLECPTDADLEGEPPLAIDYVDEWNGGCASDVPEINLQPITGQSFCGVSGWYIFQGSNVRDTDWFLIEIPQSGFLEITGDAERETYMFELGPQDCNDVAVLQIATIGPCLESTMVINGAPGSLVWFWVGPTVFASPLGIDVDEYDYVLHLNLDVVAVENRSLSEVKALFD